MTIEGQQASTRDQLLSTALRGFGPPEVEPDAAADYFQVRLGVADAPVPGLLELALHLVGATHHGAGEKVLWIEVFDYDGERYELVYAKFGVKLGVTTVKSEEDARSTLSRVTGKLRAASKIVEAMVLDGASDTMRRGQVTVLNQHRQLREAYDYFRDRAINPAHVDDVNEEGEGPYGHWSLHTSGANVMAMNSRHDFAAAVTAYFSALEHDLVLALAFADFDPDRDDLPVFIGARWGDKWKRLHGTHTPANRYFSDLTRVAERWRNPYAHGGFEKGHGATLFLHTEGIGALPVGMTRWTDSPRYSLYASLADDIEDVFGFFDKLDQWFKETHPEAMEWIDSGLAVRFDEQFRREAAAARKAGRFARFLSGHERKQTQFDNMDFY